LTRSIQVEARGEVAELKDNINTMIASSAHDRPQHRAGLAQTNLARFTGMLQGQRDLATVGRMLLSDLVPLVNAQQGVIYRMERQESAGLALLSAYADDEQDGHPQRVKIGEGLVGQCALEKRSMLISDLPDRIVPIRSALFQASPRDVIVLPVLFEAASRRSSNSPP